MTHGISGGILIDISPVLSPRIAVWPGDTPFSQRYLCRMDQGANLDLSTIESTVHLGAHADGPSHYRAGAPGIAARALDGIRHNHVIVLFPDPSLACTVRATEQAG